ncbi:hypothetical protein PCANC_17183 [Puccinia coronata f. sp. avenae]|uniref:Uncharacterized protein n=1 Tax=Puccinia coronata f. sp. avenae TaxID=200324 RepID=A0A2N5SS82_9BASI|nr:hypothetical protein PCANC_17183 [Puccinia coronata f. sp. avenae]
MKKAERFSDVRSVVRCPDVDSKTSLKCDPMSCSNFPTCSRCINTETREERDTMTCRQKYQILDTASPSFERCIDQDEREYECHGGCEGTLTCDSCTYDFTPFRVQHLQKRANPMLNGMNGGSANSNGFGGLDW